MHEGLFLIVLGTVCLASRRWHHGVLCRLADELGWKKPPENKVALIIAYSALACVGAGLVVNSLVVG